MEMSIQQPQFTDLSISNSNPEACEEIIHSSAEAPDAEMPQQTGFLLGNEGKHFVFVNVPKTPLSEKSTEVFETRQSKENQKLDLKEGKQHLSYEQVKETKIKEFQIQKSEKPSNNEKQPTLIKAQETASRCLTKTHHQFRPRLQDKPPFLNPKKSPEFSRSPAKGKETAKNEKLQKTEVKSDPPSRSLQSSQERQTKEPLPLSARESQKQDNRHEEIRKQEEKEEGFAEDQRNQNQDDTPDENEFGKITGLRNEKMNPKDFFDYAAEESTLLTELFKMRVNHFDVLILFIEVLKLSLKSREQERISRMEERELQLQHIQNIVDNFKQQGKWMLFANLGSGALGIVSGLTPIIGYTSGGDWILDKLKWAFSGLSDMEKKQFYKSAGQITQQMSKMYESTGNIQQTFSESSRTFDQHMAELRKSDWDEDTRSMEEIKDLWKNIENFLHQTLQMYHDEVGQLYRH